MSHSTDFSLHNISLAEYIPQSGVMLSLLKRRDPLNDIVISDTMEWTLDQICGVCSLLKIPFVVIVQLYLLQDKGSVRLRTILSDSTTAQNGVYESFVKMPSLASEIKERLASGSLTTRDDAKYETSSATSAFDRQMGQGFTALRDTSLTSSKHLSSSDPECIYVDTDQFYQDFEGANNKDPKIKAARKTLKTARQRAGNYITNMAMDDVLVVVVDLPFTIVREFNSAAMFKAGPNVATATVDLLASYPRYKKCLKTLAMCLDHLSRRELEERKPLSHSGRESLLNILVLSFPDDRFDLLTLDIYRSSKSQNTNIEKVSQKSSKRDRNNGRR